MFRKLGQSMYKLAIYFLIILPILAYATDVYQWKDTEGIVHYSDSPQSPDAQPVTLKIPTLSTQSQDNSEQITKPTTENKTSDLITYRIEIQSPLPDQTIRDAEGKVDIQVKINPEPIRVGKVKFRFILDGKQVAESPNSSMQLLGLDRGEHRITVALVDENALILTSSTMVTFYVHKPMVMKKQKK
jgi:hypothetical protein